MGRGVWAGLLVAVLGVDAFGQPADPASQVDPIVVVRVHESVPVAATMRAPAWHMASDIFRQAGVTVIWDGDGGMPADRRLTVTLTMSNRYAGVVPAQAFGVAPSPGDGTRGTQAFVFLDRVRAFAETHRLEPAHVLACALAHEIGHLLLPPNAHRDDSVMRASWHPKLFPPHAPGVLGFPPDQARLLRRRAARPATALTSPPAPVAAASSGSR